MKGQIKIGTYEGTGDALNVKIGFVPDFLFIVNVDDGDLVGMWFNGMADDTAVDIATEVAANAAGGVTAYAGTRGEDSAGFTVGTDYSENGKTYRYFAVANQ